MSECFIDGTFSLAKKGGFLWERLWRGKGSKIMAITYAGGVVLSVSVQSASPQEVTLVETILEERFVDDLPEKLIGDKAYDSDALDQLLAGQGVELIALHRAGRKKTERKTDANYGAIEEDGKWNASLPGCSTTANASSAMNTKNKTLKPLCSSLV